MDGPPLVRHSGAAPQRPPRLSHVTANTAHAKHVAKAAAGQRVPRRPMENDSAQPKPESLFDRLAREWGLGCMGPMDVGALDCAMRPTRFDQCARYTSEGLYLASPLPCHGPSETSTVCCVPEDLVTEAQMFAACVVCALRPASILEVPCGHINVCCECHRDYQTNTRCIRCRENVPIRIDLAPFLDATGRPVQCLMCQAAVASVVMMPCIHMAFCHRCLPTTVAGCPTCGERVTQTCKVLWAAPSPPEGRRVLPGSREGLDRVTEDVDEQISRLERQLRNLRPNAAIDGTASSDHARANMQVSGSAFIPAAASALKVGARSTRTSLGEPRRSPPGDSPFATHLQRGKDQYGDAP
jgi:hypothetical protein